MFPLQPWSTAIPTQPWGEETPRKSGGGWSIPGTSEWQTPNGSTSTGLSLLPSPSLPCGFWEGTAWPRPLLLHQGSSPSRCRFGTRGCWTRVCPGPEPSPTLKGDGGENVKPFSVSCNTSSSRSIQNKHRGCSNRPKAAIGVAGAETRAGGWRGTRSPWGLLLWGGSQHPNTPAPGCPCPRGWCFPRNLSTEPEKFPLETASC